MNMEKWRNVPGFEGKYQIDISTPEGKCRSLCFRGHEGFTRELTVKPSKRDRRIYWQFYKDGKGIKWQAARWIALTFPEFVQNEYFEGAEIDHIDSNPMNNHPSNLRWVRKKDQAKNLNTRLKQSLSHLGVPKSQETRRRMSEAHKKIK